MMAEKADQIMTGFKLYPFLLGNYHITNPIYFLTHSEGEKNLNHYLECF